MCPLWARLVLSEQLYEQKQELMAPSSGFGEDFFF